MFGEKARANRAYLQERTEQLYREAAQKNPGIQATRDRLYRLLAVFVALRVLFGIYRTILSLPVLRPFDFVLLALEIGVSFLFSWMVYSGGLCRLGFLPAAGGAMSLFHAISAYRELAGWTLALSLTAVLSAYQILVFGYAATSSGAKEYGAVMQKIQGEIKRDLLSR